MQMQQLDDTAVHSAARYNLTPEIEPLIDPAPVEPLPLPLTIQLETAWKRVLFFLFALAIAAGFLFFLTSFLAPAPGRPGIDENAYLVGGKMIAQHATTGFKPTDDYQFVGAMWIRTPSGWYYPKYPFGTSLLNAIPVLLHHREWAFFVSPVCASLGVFAIFFLAREIVGSFYALLAMILLATGPTTLLLADIPSSHAPALCFVAWGMFFLLRWWQTGRWPLGLLAGLLLGFAVTIRYTEALLLFPFYSLSVVRADGYIGPKLLPFLKVLGFLPFGPLGIAVLARMKWRSWRSYFPAGIPILGWAVPVGALLLFNYFTLGHFTGYDSTHESNGFSIDTFLHKWDFTIHQLYVFGLFLLPPLGLAGFILMFRGNRRAALLLTLWFFPGVLLYTAYYWGANLPGIAFLRFFLTLFPPLIIAAMYLLRRAEPGAGGSFASPLAAGLLTAITASIGIYGSLSELERQHRGTLNLQYSAHQIMLRAKSPPGHQPMILADSGMFPQLLQYMQFMLDADWYLSDAFAPHAGGGFGLAGLFQRATAADSNAPVALQRERIDYIDAFRKGKTDADYIHDCRRLIDQALSTNRKVYALLPPAEANFFRNRFTSAPYEMVELSRWWEPCTIHYPDPGERNYLMLPTDSDNALLPWHAQYRGLYQIYRSPTTRPTSIQ